MKAKNNGIDYDDIIEKDKVMEASLDLTDGIDD